MNKHTNSSNMLAVLMYLFEKHMKNSAEIEISVGQLTNELSEAGFSSTSINKAFNWLKQLQEKQNTVTQKPINKKSIRIFSREERAKLNKDCCGLIMQLERKGILNAETRELVISQVLQLDKKLINPAHVKWVTLMVLFNQPNSNDAISHMEHLVLNTDTGNIN